MQMSSSMLIQISNVVKVALDADANESRGSNRNARVLLRIKESYLADDLVVGLLKNLLACGVRIIGSSKCVLR